MQEKCYKWLKSLIDIAIIFINNNIIIIIIIIIIIEIIGIIFSSFGLCSFLYAIVQCVTFEFPIELGFLTIRNK
jgi:hypothetical protein